MNIIERTKNGVTFFQSDGIDAAGGAVHGFSTRKGGVSQGMWESLNLGPSRGDDPDHVRENYRRVFAAIGADGGAKAESPPAAVPPARRRSGRPTKKLPESPGPPSPSRPSPPERTARASAASPTTGADAAAAKAAAVRPPKLNDPFPDDVPRRPLRRAAGFFNQKGALPWENLPACCWPATLTTP